MRKITYNGKDHNVFHVSTEYCEADIILVAETYARGGNLAVEAYEVEEGEVTDLFATLTVNIIGERAGTYGRFATVDTNNNPWAEDFLKENGLARDTGARVRSGFCTYPFYEFDTSKF